MSIAIDPSSAAPPPGGITRIVVAVLLVSALIARESFVSTPDQRGRTVGEVLDIVILPLLTTLVLLGAMRLLPASA